MVVKWSHEEDEEPVNGFYVAVQLMGRNGAQLGVPKFVHIDGEKREVEIRGVKPRAQYQMTVSDI